MFVDRLIVGELKNVSLKTSYAAVDEIGFTCSTTMVIMRQCLKAKDKYQFYYRGDNKPGNHWKKGWEQYHEGEVTLYAESKDAINWTLPKLGLYPDHPTFPNGNVVLQDEFLVNQQLHTPSLIPNRAFLLKKNTKH